MGVRKRLTATGNFSDGSSLDLTRSATFESDAPQIASIQDRRDVKAEALGTANVRVTARGVSATTAVTVSAAVVEKLVLSPLTPHAGIANGEQMHATAIYTDTRSFDVTDSASWSSSDRGVATIGATTGTVSGVAGGRTTITAAFQGLSATASLAVGSNPWGASTPQSTGRSWHSASLLPDGRVLVAGGSSWEKRAEIYDPKTDAWSWTGALSAGRSLHASVTLPSGKVLAIAGDNAPSNSITGNAPGSAELFDPATGLWTSTPALLAPRTQPRAVLLSNGRVLLAGGLTPTGNGFMPDAELYDPAANIWTSAAPLATGRYFHGLTTLNDGRVLASGGVRNGGASTEIYDPAANSWSAGGEMVTDRAFHTATLLLDGRVLVAGGAAPSCEVASVEIFDPATGSWSAAAPMHEARYHHSAIRLPDGRVLVTGGYTCMADFSAGAEIYDPASNTWTAIGPLTRTRAMHTSTLLSSSKVLLVGGGGGAGGSSEVSWRW